ncbi:tetratricopeptide repeat-containing sensor histidine kinase [Pedobacter steynii]|uniref:Signal transduction histidine kinase internal region domain-containing protein n=1 Tax=Pedobacter steynii TaxID=430522 RepID=A0A1D7QNV7_9SPHI|nr:histidine kinase [Pedobacter steynii]AOM80372.1 hypothetical protein BFS30_26315 [Pedobacter steynii]
MKTYFYRYAAVLAFCFAFFSCQKTNKVIENQPLKDRLSGELNAIFSKITNENTDISDPKKTLEILSDAEKRYAADTLAIAYINLFKCDCYSELGQFDQALICNNIAYNYFKNYPHTARKEYIDVLRGASLLYASLGDSERAINYIKKAEYEALIKQPGQSTRVYNVTLANIYGYYAYILELDKDLKKSRGLLLKSIKLNLSGGQTKGTTLKAVYYNLANLYEQSNQIDSALFYLKRSKTYLSANKKINEVMQMEYNRLQSRIYVRQNKIDSAIYTAEESFAGLDSTRMIINNDVATELALNYLKLGSLKKANQYYQHAKSYFFKATVSDYTSKEKIITGLIAFALQTKKNADLDILIKAYQKFARNNYDSEKAKALKNAEVIYQVKAQNDKIEKLASENSLKSTVIKQRTVLLSAIFILLATSIFFYYRQLRLKEKHRAIDLEQRLRLAQMNPHFIANALSAIQKEIYEHKNDLAISYLNKYAVLNRLILENSRNKYIYLDDELNILRNYIELQQIRFTNKFEYIFDVADDLVMEEIKIPNMLLQPIIENAIEHAFKNMIDRGLLELKIFLQGVHLVCEVKDNGHGLSHQIHKQGKKSFSIQIIKERLALLNKETGNRSSFEMNPRDDGQKGLVVKLTIPIITDYD